MQQSLHEAVLRAGADPKGNKSANFLATSRRSFIGAPVTVSSEGERHLLIGSMLFSVGAGEWVEYRPFIALGSDLKVRRLGAALVGGGAPGCHDVLPDPAQLPD